MPPETTGTAGARHDAGTAVVFSQGIAGHQIWTSVATGRIFEVQPTASWLPTELLEAGDVGELHYRGPRPLVARIVVRGEPPSEPSNARGWVRCALAELGTHAEQEALEAAAVMSMRSVNLDPTAARACDMAIAVLCTTLERHRRALQ